MGEKVITEKAFFQVQAEVHQALGVPIHDALEKPAGEVIGQVQEHIRLFGLPVTPIGAFQLRVLEAKPVVQPRDLRVLPGVNSAHAGIFTGVVIGQPTLQEIPPDQPLYAGLVKAVAEKVRGKGIQDCVTLSDLQTALADHQSAVLRGKAVVATAPLEVTHVANQTLSVSDTNPLRGTIVVEAAALVRGRPDRHFQRMVCVSTASNCGILWSDSDTGPDGKSLSSTFRIAAHLARLGKSESSFLEAQRRSIPVYRGGAFGQNS